MKTITLYTTEPCGYCSRAKALLKAKGIPYEEINLARDAAGRAELVERTGLMTFPQVVIDGRTLGGFRELAQAAATGRLQDLVAA